MTLKVFTLTISCEGEAFTSGNEIANILKEVAQRMNQVGILVPFNSLSIQDSNSQLCGTYKLKDYEHNKEGMN